MRQPRGGPLRTPSAKRGEGVQKPASVRPWARSGPAALSALAAAVLCLPTLGHALAWDDRDLIERNRLFQAGAPLGQILTSDFWAGSGLHSGFWRPLVTFSYWLELRLFHGAPAGFHAMNIALHAAASALVAALAGGLGAGPIAALLAGLWFALLPAHVESVALVSGRTDVYSAVLLLLAFWLDRRARAAGAGTPGLLAPLALALALLAKEAAVVFLPLLLVAEMTRPAAPRAPREARSGHAGIGWYLPYLAVTLIYAVVHVVVVPPAGLLAGVDPLEMARVRAGTWIEFPAQLAFLWPWANHAPGPALHLPPGFADPVVIASLLFQLAFVAVLAWLVRRRTPAALPMALVWLPTLPVTWAGLASGRLLFAERFLYLPSVGVAWLLALGLQTLLPGRGHHAERGPAAGSEAAGPRLAAWIGLGATGVLILGGAVESVRALPMWRNDEAVFGSMVARRPENAVGHAVMARQWLSQGRLPAATAAVREALARDPRSPFSHTVDAMVHMVRGEWDSAIVAADRALALDSSQVEARLVRGGALMETGRRAEARAMLEPLVAADPGNPAVQAEWGRWLMLENRPGEALPFLAAAVKDPAQARKAELRYELGMAEAATGRMRDALPEFRDAVLLDPTHYDAWLRLALASQLFGETAVRDTALARAARLPQAADGRVEKLRRQIAAMPGGAAAGPPPK